jgi:hypothetical protein
MCVCDREQTCRCPSPSFPSHTHNTLTRAASAVLVATAVDLSNGKSTSFRDMHAEDVSRLLQRVSKGVKLTDKKLKTVFVKKKV